MRGLRVDVSSTARRQLPVADYADAFAIQAEEEFPAMGWVREALEHVAVLDMIAMQAIWRIVLGLRLDALGSSGHVAGWRILEEGDDAVVLGADSRVMDARIVFEVTRQVATMTTLLRFRSHSRLARVVWLAAGTAHRRAVPKILGRSRAGLGLHSAFGTQPNPKAVRRP
jgi:hypothetical protein